MLSMWMELTSIEEVGREQLVWINATMKWFFWAFWRCCCFLFSLLTLFLDYVSTILSSLKEIMKFCAFLVSSQIMCLFPTMESFKHGFQGLFSFIYQNTMTKWEFSCLSLVYLFLWIFFVFVFHLLKLPPLIPLG